MWKPLYDKYGFSINFAHTTFRWDSEASSKAQVHCVIVGFGTNNRKEKRLYTSEQYTIAHNINPYLVNADSVFVERHSTPICNTPEMVRGSQPTDDGNLILTEEEKDELLKREPQAAQFIRPFMMGKDFIQRKPRYCLWLVGANPSELKKCHLVLDRVEKVRKFRLNSTKKATQEKAETPTLFDEIKNAKPDYIAVPKVSS